jgi:hypothetical protein
VVSLTPGETAPPPRYPLDRRLGGPLRRSGRYGEVKILGPTGTRNPPPPSSSPWPVVIPHWVPEAIFLGIRWPGRKADHLQLGSRSSKRESIHPLPHSLHGVIKHRSRQLYLYPVGRRLGGPLTLRRREVSCSCRESNPAVLPAAIPT